MRIADQHCQRTLGKLERGLDKVMALQRLLDCIWQAAKSSVKEFCAVLEARSWLIVFQSPKTSCRRLPLFATTGNAIAIFDVFFLQCRNHITPAAHAAAQCSAGILWGGAEHLYSSLDGFIANYCSLGLADRSAVSVILLLNISGLASGCDL
jgi:hypothetical protein